MLVLEGLLGRYVTRRGVLAAATAALSALASGCKGVGALGTPPKPLPDVAVVRAAIAGETLMIARYRAVLEAVGALAPMLHPVLAQHHDHLARLRARLVVPRGAMPPSPTPSATPSPGPGSVPAAPAAALGYLRDAEDAAATSLLAHLGAVSPSCAQLLASIAASEAAHAMILHPAPGRPR